LNEIGIGGDFRDAKKALKDIVGRLDHNHLNELPAFQKENPTSENIARFLYGELSRKLNADGVKVSRVKVFETPAAGVCYWEE